MNRYIAHTQSARADGVAKYPKGYEQHMAPEGGFGDTPHIKWYNNGGDGHIFMTPQTNMENSYTFNKLNKIIGRDNRNLRFTCRSESSSELRSLLHCTQPRCTQREKNYL